MHCFQATVFLIVGVDAAFSLFLAMGALWVGDRTSFYLHLLEIAVCGSVVYAVVKCRPSAIFVYLVYSVGIHYYCNTLITVNTLVVV